MNKITKITFGTMLVLSCLGMASCSSSEKETSSITSSATSVKGSSVSTLDPNHVHEYKDIVLMYGNNVKAMPTCTTGAEYYKACECGALSTETFFIDNALGHDKVNVAQIDPDCGHDGQAACVQCTRCHEILSGGEVIPATGDHHYNDIGVCSVCGDFSGTKITIGDNDDSSCFGLGNFDANETVYYEIDINENDGCEFSLGRALPSDTFLNMKVYDYNGHELLSALNNDALETRVSIKDKGTKFIFAVTNSSESSNDMNIAISKTHDYGNDGVCKNCGYNDIKTISLNTTAHFTSKSYSTFKSEEFFASFQGGAKTKFVTSLESYAMIVYDEKGNSVDCTDGVYETSAEGLYILQIENYEISAPHDFTVTISTVE